MLLEATGYGLNLDYCTCCRKKINVTNYIDVSNFGGICESCIRQHGIYLSKGAYNSLKFLLNTSPDKIYRLKISDDIKKEIEKIQEACPHLDNELNWTMADRCPYCGKWIR